MSCGHYHTLLLTTSGLVYGFGSNVDGQLGQHTDHITSITPTLIEDICHIPMSMIAAGSFSACVSKENGNVFLWGTGTFGQFKTPHRVKKIEQKVIAVSLGDQFGCVLTDDRKLYLWGINSHG